MTTAAVVLQCNPEITHCGQSALSGLENHNTALEYEVGRWGGKLHKGGVALCTNSSWGHRNMCRLCTWEVWLTSLGTDFYLNISKALDGWMSSNIVLVTCSLCEVLFLSEVLFHILTFPGCFLELVNILKKKKCNAHPSTLFWPQTQKCVLSLNHSRVSCRNTPSTLSLFWSLRLHRNCSLFHESATSKEA